MTMTLTPCLRSASWQLRLQPRSPCLQVEYTACRRSNNMLGTCGGWCKGGWQKPTMQHGTGSWRVRSGIRRVKRAQAVETKRACPGTGSRPALEPKLMMAVPIPFFTCNHHTSPLWDFASSSALMTTHALSCGAPLLITVQMNVTAGVDEQTLSAWKCRG